MSVDTTIRAMSEIDYRLFFLQARKAVGIPDEWPFEDEYDGAQHVVMSELGGGDASVTVYSHEYETRPWDDEDEGPMPCHADVFFCSSRWDGKGSAEALHRDIVNELGEWLDGQGVQWAVAIDGTWEAQCHV